MALSPQPIDVERTAIAIAYKNPKYIFREVLPEFKVGKRSFKWTEHSKQDSFTVPNTTVGRRGEINEVEFRGTRKDSSVVDQALTHVVPQDDIDNAAEGVDEVGNRTLETTKLLELARERRVADLVFNPDTYPAGNKTTLSGTSQWNDPASNPVAAISEALDGMFVRANIIVMGQRVLSKLKVNSKIIQAIYPGAAGGLITTQQLADLFEVEQIIVGRGWVNAGPKTKSGQFTPTRLWGNHCALLYRADDITSGDDITFGATATFGNRIVKTWQPENRGLREPTNIKVGESLRELIMCPDLGYFFQNAVA
ncbi:MAG: hypothetical protein LBM75_09230 [Myxococcales bacterium]|jgi:hypothetical protein|nr:hypothetical protein [Myxococcales bacterium]